MRTIDLNDILVKIAEYIKRLKWDKEKEFLILYIENMIRDEFKPMSYYAEKFDVTEFSIMKFEEHLRHHIGLLNKKYL